MSYDEHDAAMDEMYAEIAKELYPEHKVQAIEEFTAERLKSFYIKNPEVMCSAVTMYKEAHVLHEEKHYAAALVFFSTAIELFLKASLLKPVIYGLVHNENLADIIVKHALDRAGFERYNDLLARLFDDIAGIDIEKLSRTDTSKSILLEVKDIQGIRNKIIHQGESCTETDSSLAKEVATGVLNKIVLQMLYTLDLSIYKKGIIKPD